MPQKLNDNTRLIKCTIVNDLTVSSHTEYVLRVETERDGCPGEHWLVQKRFREFVILDKQLRTSRLPLPLPPKKYFGNMKKSFICKRKNALQTYLDVVVSNPYLKMCRIVRQFLDPDTDYNLRQREAFRIVTELLSKESLYEIIRPLPDIGWRTNKCYFLVRSIPKPFNGDKILSWIWFGEEEPVPSHELRDLIVNLRFMRNPSIVPIEYVNCCDKGALFVRHYNPTGTLRDLLARANPSEPHIRKYCNPPRLMVLYNQLIRKFGRDLLEALDELQKRHLPYGHLHASNIIYEDGHLRLLDVENALMGLRPVHYGSRWLCDGRVDSWHRVDTLTFLDTLHETIYGHAATGAPPITTSLSPAIVRVRHLLAHQPPPPDIVNLLVPVRHDPGVSDDDPERELVAVKVLRLGTEFHVWNGLRCPLPHKTDRHMKWRMTQRMKSTLYDISDRVERKLVEDKLRLLTNLSR